MRSTHLASTVVILFVSLTLPGYVSAGAEGPDQYFCFDATQTTSYQVAFTGVCLAESPFASLARDNSFIYFHLEDAGDYTTATGVVASPPVGETAGGNNSVDADDGTINNLGFHSVGFSSDDTTYTFDAGVLGVLPTHVGIVMTHGTPDLVDIQLEAFGPGGVPLGTIGPAAAGGFNNSAADRFFGWSDPGGIESFRLLNTSNANAIQVDHLQYGAVAPVVPALNGWAKGIVVVGVLLGSVAVIHRDRSKAT